MKRIKLLTIVIVLLGTMVTSECQTTLKGIGVEVDGYANKSKLGNGNSSSLGQVAKGYIKVKTVSASGVFNFDYTQFRVGLRMKKYKGHVTYITEEGGFDPGLLGLFVSIFTGGSAFNGSPPSAVYHATPRLKIDATYATIPMAFRINLVGTDKRLTFYVEPELSIDIPISIQYKGEVTSNEDFRNRARSALKRLEKEQNGTILIPGISAGFKLRNERFDIFCALGLRAGSTSMMKSVGGIGRSAFFNMGLGYEIVQGRG